MGIVHGFPWLMEVYFIIVRVEDLIILCCCLKRP